MKSIFHHKSTQENRRNSELSLKEKRHKFGGRGDKTANKLNAYFNQADYHIHTAYRDGVIWKVLVVPKSHKNERKKSAQNLYT